MRSLSLFILFVLLLGCMWALGALTGFDDAPRQHIKEWATNSDGKPLSVQEQLRDLEREIKDVGRQANMVVTVSIRAIPQYE